MSTTGTWMAFQHAGLGRLEGHPPGDVDGARFEGRFVIYNITGPDGSWFGDDVSLFAPDVVAEHGRGPQSAHFVAVRSGYVLEGFVTGYGDEFPGHTIGRTATATRLRVYYDPTPDGSRSFDDRASFMSGTLVATYRAEEFFQIDPLGGVFDTRVNYTLLDSTPITHGGVELDLATFAPRMVEKSHGHNPSPDPSPETIPAEEPFLGRPGGVFDDHFPLGGSITVC